MENPTKHKIQEAKYFLDEMKQSYEDDDTFAYNFSAFLSATRSITFSMKKQYNCREGFAEWYRQKREEMVKNLELQCLKAVRNEDIHKELVPTGATRQIQIGVSVILTKEGTPEVEQAKKAEHKSPTQSDPKTVWRFFPKSEDTDVKIPKSEDTDVKKFCKFDEDTDVIEFCEKQLITLTKIGEECEKQFPMIFLPARQLTRHKRLTPKLLHNFAYTGTVIRN